MSSKSGTDTSSVVTTSILLDSIQIIQDDNHINSNVRKSFTPDKMVSLRESIRTKGLLYPLIVRNLDGNHILLGGERRLRSIQKLVKDNVPCWSYAKNDYVPAKELYAKIEVKLFTCNDFAALQLAFADNNERADLTEIEKINACVKYDNAKDENGDKLFTRLQIADIFQVSESWVSQTISIGDLPKCVLDALGSGLINRTVAIQLLKSDRSKIPQVIDMARQFHEKDFADKLKEATEEVESLREKVLETQATVELAEVRIKRAEPSHKSKAKQLLKDANSQLGQASNELAKASERLKALNSASNVKCITADNVSMANESLGARIGKGRPYSTKQIREVKEAIDKSLQTAKGKKQKLVREVLNMAIRFVLREDNHSDVLSLCAAADALVE